MLPISNVPFFTREAREIKLKPKVSGLTSPCVTLYFYNVTTINIVCTCMWNNWYNTFMRPIFASMSRSYYVLSMYGWRIYSTIYLNKHRARGLHDTFAHLHSSRLSRSVKSLPVTITNDEAHHVEY